MGNDEEKQDKRGFKVEDRRRFSDSGDARPAPVESVSGDVARPAAATTEPAVTATAEPQEREDAPLEINFSTFVLSLSTQALAHLGEIPDPIDNRAVVDLGAAKQLIDILGILEDKTKGNLDKTEHGLLESVLYDLRIRYVERARDHS